MTKISISGIHDVSIHAYKSSVTVDFDTAYGKETTRIEFEERSDAELLLARLGEALGKV